MQAKCKQNASILQANCKQIASILQANCKQIASILQANCNQNASKMQANCKQIASKIQAKLNKNYKMQKMQLKVDLKIIFHKAKNINNFIIPMCGIFNNFCELSLFLQIVVTFRKF